MKIIELIRSEAIALGIELAKDSMFPVEDGDDERAIQNAFYKILKEELKRDGVETKEYDICNGTYYSNYRGEDLESLIYEYRLVHFTVATALSVPFSYAKLIIR